MSRLIFFNFREKKILKRFLPTPLEPLVTAKTQGFLKQ